MAQAKKKAKKPYFKLTPKQESFCKKYVETSNASEAYRLCYKADKMKDSVIHVKASELLKNGKVEVRVAELLESHRARHNVTVDSITERLDKAYVVAEKYDQSNFMTTAAMATAKLHGLITDKQKIELEGESIQLNVHFVDAVPAGAEK